MNLTDLEWLLAWSVRASLILVAAGLISLLLRGQAASLRHAAWGFAIAGALAMPILSALLPGWQILPPGTGGEASPRSPAAEDRSSATLREHIQISPPATSMSERLAAAGADQIPPAPAAAHNAIAWPRVLLWVWLTGSCVLALRIFVGQCSVWRIRLLATPHARLSGELPVRLSERAIPPMVCGLIKPVILLPREAADWPEARLRAVLQHERAHTRRGDLWTGLLASLLCTAQWFNPLAWLASARLRTEAERACDDAVIRSGVPGTEYAGHLLEVAALTGMKTRPLPAAAMASGTEVEGRLRYAIDPQRNRRGLGICGWLLLAGALAPLTLAFALAAGQEPAQAADPGSDKPAAEPGAQRQFNTIVLDPGHGGSDPGVTTGGAREKDANLKLALTLRDRLEKAGFRVVLTRFDDSTTSLPERAMIANRELGAAMVSLHFDRLSRARPTRYQIYSAEKPRSAAASLKGALASSLAEAFPDEQIQRPEAPWTIFTLTRVPSVMFQGVLPEAGDSERVLATIAGALASGVISWAAQPQPEPPAEIGGDDVEVEADEVNYDTERQLIVAEGSASYRTGTLELGADRIEHQTSGKVCALGRVRIESREANPLSFSAEAPRVELEPESGFLRLSGKYKLRLGQREMTGTSDESAATLNLQTGTLTTIGKSRVEIHPAPAADGAAAPAVKAIDVRIADGFDFPVGKPDAEGYYIARGFISGANTNETWNGIGGGNSDLGDPVYTIGHGSVVFAQDVKSGWGNVLIIRHAYRDPTGDIRQIDSLYGHLERIDVALGDEVVRGQQVGTIGNNRGMYLANLSFEIRKNTQIGIDRSKFARDESNYHDPSAFIRANRPAK